MPYASVIAIDDDINDYDIDKADDLLDLCADKNSIISALRSWLSRDQYIQFVGDNFGWEEIERDGLHDDVDEDEDDFYDYKAS